MEIKERFLISLAQNKIFIAETPRAQRGDFLLGGEPFGTLKAAKQEPALFGTMSFSPTTTLAKASILFRRR